LKLPSATRQFALDVAILSDQITPWRLAATSFVNLHLEPERDLWKRS